MDRRVNRRALLFGALGAGAALLLGRTTGGSEIAEGEIERTWSRIEAWMRAEAPEALAVLRPGASAARIRGAQERLGVRFPESLTRSLARHDGQEWAWPSLVEFGILMPLDEIVVRHAENERHGVDAFVGNEDEAWWRRGWLPFVSRDGDYLALALGPGDAGEVWAFQHDQDPVFSVVAPDYATWLAAWADELQAGVFGLDRAPGAGLIPREGTTSRIWPA